MGGSGPGSGIAVAVTVAVFVLTFLLICCCGCGGGGSSSSGSNTKPSYCNGPFAAINSYSDLSDLAACSTYYGSVRIDSSMRGSLELGQRLTQITANLECSGSQLTSIEAASLKTIGGNLVMTDMSSLTSVDFGSLSRIDGALKLRDLPRLQALDGFHTLAEVGDLSIVGNISSSDFPSLQRINNNSTIVLNNNSNNRSFCQVATKIRHSSDSNGLVHCVAHSELSPSTAGAIAAGAGAGLILLGASAARQRFIAMRLQRESETQATSEQRNVESGDPIPTTPRHAPNPILGQLRHYLARFG